MKEIIRKFIEYIYLIKTHPKSYEKFFLYERPTIYKVLKENGIKKIKPVQKHEWKIWFNCYYFSGILQIDKVKKNVFIKVMDCKLEDCYYNEQQINNYIDQESPFLKSRKPKLYHTIIINGLYIMVYDFVKMDSVFRTVELDKSVEEVVSEYTRIGIVHTDFARVNIGMVNNNYYFFDYGTSLFQGSNRIRLRKGQAYNHIEQITETARRIMPDADYYYDDLIHYGLDNTAREKINFIVAKDTLCLVKLGESIYKYKLEKMKEGSSVYLLCKED